MASWGTRYRIMLKPTSHFQSRNQLASPNEDLVLALTLLTLTEKQIRFLNRDTNSKKRINKQNNPNKH